MDEKFVIQWHITGRCNLRCKHCYIDEYNKDLRKDNLIGIFYQIKDFLEKYGYHGHINFTGGEPFMCEHIWDLLDLCDEYNITFGILTNGTLINDYILSRLSKYNGLSFVQISLDGDKKLHDYIRGKGNFNKACKALRLLNKYNIISMVSFTATKQNYKLLTKVIRICRLLKVKRFWTDRLIPIGSNTLDIMSTEEFNEYNINLTKEAKKNKILNWFKLSNTIIHTNRALQFIYNDSCAYECSAGVRLLAILEDGTLLPCRRLPLILGNLISDNIIDVMETSSIISDLKSDKTAENCEKCVYNKTCKGGAKCLTYAVKGKLHSKDINCPLNPL